VTRTLIAVDTSAVAPTLVAVGRTLAEVLATDADVVHVREGPRPTSEELGHVLGTPVRALEGDPTAQLLSALSAPDVALGVVGTGTRPDDGAIGHVARALLVGAGCPVLVVPPHLRRPLSSPPRGVLVPLEGAVVSDAAVRPIVDRLAAAGSTVTVAHVFDQAHPPGIVDHPEHGLEGWGREFLTRSGRAGGELVLRRGVPWQQVLGCVAELEVQLLVLAWSQRLTEGHAAVVRGALGRAGIPVLLVPLAPV
jgi:nucleotide-binding universal stress UspA family protein